MNLSCGVACLKPGFKQKPDIDCYSNGWLKQKINTSTEGFKIPIKICECYIQYISPLQAISIAKFQDQVDLLFNLMVGKEFGIWPQILRQEFQDGGDIALKK